MADVAVAQPTPAGTTDENVAPASSDEIKTVFHDVNNFNVKHPLLNTWSLWVSLLPAVRGATLTGTVHQATLIKRRQLE